MRLAIVFYLLLWMTEASSQSFVKFFEKPDSSINANEIHDIYYDEDQKVYFALLLLSMDSCQGFGVTKLDEEGEILKEYIYCSQDSLDQFLYFSPDVGLQKINDNLFYFRGNSVFSGFRTFDYWFDSDLNPVQYKISDTISTDSVQAHQVLKLASYSDKIVQAGQLQKLNFESDSYIKVIDNEGNDVWTKEYFVDDGYSHYISSLVVHDSILILGTTKSILSSGPTDKSHCHISFIDQENGEILHEFDLDVPEKSNIGPTDVIPFERDGFFLLAFSSRESTYNNDYFEFRNQIRYFITDLDGNVIDSIRLGNDSNISNGLFFNERTDQGFISSGNLLVDDTFRSLVIGLFDETADTIWWSEYDFNNSNEYAEYYNVTGQTVLSDGSIVICGNLAELELPFFQPVRERPFILKLDSDGCLEPGCREMVNTTSINHRGKPVFYPNPFDNSFTFLSPNEGILKVYDLLGRQVLLTKMVKGENVIDFSKEKSGVFLYNFWEGDKITLTGKLIKS